MNKLEIERLEKAIKTGIRVKSNGDKIRLSNEMYKSFVMRLRAEKANRGKMAYVSASPNFNGKGEFLGYTGYGPAVSDGQGGYLSMYKI